MDQKTNITRTLSSDFVDASHAADLLAGGGRTRCESKGGLSLHYFEDGSLLVESATGEFALVH